MVVHELWASHANIFYYVYLGVPTLLKEFWSDILLLLCICALASTKKKRTYI